VSACGAPRAVLDLRGWASGGAPLLQLLREAEQHDVAHASPARAGVGPETDLAAAADEM
jgi:hypothetical protein